MASLHPAATSPLSTGHHCRKTGVLLRRPALHSPRRSRLHAQKPGSTGAGAETPSSSESENVVLKAAWYGSEVLGIAASFFRPSPSSPEGGARAADEATSESQSLGREQVAEAIKDDFARSYFVTGNLTLRAYEDDCEFADPAGSFRGLGRFKRNCTNFGSLLEKSNMKLTKWEDLKDKSIGHWRFSCVMSFPWRPILSATGYTEYYFDSESGKVCRYLIVSGASVYDIHMFMLVKIDRYVQACGALERSQDGTPTADFQAEQMGMGETLKRVQRSRGLAGALKHRTSHMLMLEFVRRALR